MFNDSLSVPQCAKLVKQLSETAFPFQCAHGRFVDHHILTPNDVLLTLPHRPSIVPLVDTGTLLARTNKLKRPQNDWEMFGATENQS